MVFKLFSSKILRASENPIYILFFCFISGWNGSRHNDGHVPRSGTSRFTVPRRWLRHVLGRRPSHGVGRESEIRENAVLQHGPHSYDQAQLLERGDRRNRLLDHHVLQ